MSKRINSNASLATAQRVSNAHGGQLRAIQSGVRMGPFVVVRTPPVPGVSIEPHLTIDDSSVHKPKKARTKRSWTTKRKKKLKLDEIDARTAKGTARA